MKSTRFADASRLARATFEEIRAAYPRLLMVIDEAPTQVDLAMTIAEQPGLDFALEINLQGDELHLSVGALWLRWFPGDNDDVVAAYRAAVVGLLRGDYRIVEYSAGGRVFRAELERAVSGRWESIGESTRHWNVFRRRLTARVLRNRF
jgi:hypothetical protein